MLRQVIRICRPRCLVIPKANHQNYVMSEVLAQIERECDRFCPIPRVPPQKAPTLSVSDLFGEDATLTSFLLKEASSQLTPLGSHSPLTAKEVNLDPQPTSSTRQQLSNNRTSTPIQDSSKPSSVAVIGAGSDVGRMACLFLKQQKIIKVLSLYDDDPENNVLGVATDLAHIDTSPTVEAYQGRVFIQNALHDSDVVLICGGHYVMPPCCCTLDRVLFFQNMHHVRTAVIACAQFCPQAVIAVQTPPVDCNFALCVDTLKLACVYDKRKVLGVNAINSMRANQLFCALTGTDPSTNTTPVVGGTGKCTRVPVFSVAKAGNFPQTQVDCLTRLVREADDIICRVKSNNEQGHLSIGFSTARFVVNIMKGLFEKPTFIDSALVEQNEPEKCYNMPICATPVTVGKQGIVEYAVPNLNDSEKRLLEDAKCDLEDMINLGSCYALGDEYCLHPCKMCSCYYYPPPCPVVQPCEQRSG